MTHPLFRSATPHRGPGLVAVILLVACVVAAPAQARQVTQPPRADETRTVRSDGTLAPQVRQTPRREQRRQSRVTASTQALPPPGSWQDGIDPPEGGLTVAPAGTVAGDGTGVPLVGVVDIPLRPAPPPPVAPAAVGGNR